MDAAIEHYWCYLRSKGFPGSFDKPGSGCIPLWIWGDDTQYNEKGSKIVVICIGAVLHTNETVSTKDSIFPLCVYQVDSQLKHCFFLFMWFVLVLPTHGFP